MSTAARPPWKLDPVPLQAALERWSRRVRSKHDEDAVNDALMDLVTNPLARGREDGDSGIFYAALPERIIIVFTLAPDPDPDGSYRVGLVDIDYA